MKLETLHRRLTLLRCEHAILLGTSNDRNDPAQRKRENRKDTVRKAIRKLEARLPASHARD